MTGSETANSGSSEEMKKSQEEIMSQIENERMGIKDMRNDRT